MQEIKDFTENLNKQRKTNTLLIGGFLAAGLIFSVPMFSDSIKHEETLYCTKGVKCEGYNVKRGISFLVDRERRNKTFDDNIKVLKVLPPEDGLGISLGLLSSVSLFLSFCVSRTLTNTQEEAIHSKFKMLKIKAIESDILEKTHIDLFEFSKAAQVEVARDVISRDAQGTLSSLKSEGELKLDSLKGQLEGQLALKTHQFRLSELEKETAKNNLEILELNKKATELNKDKKAKEEENKNTTLEDVKIAMVNALKSHEDGWLWYLVESFTPIIIWGKPGSYKSYTAAAVALLKHYLIDAGIESIADIDYEQNKNSSWKYLIPLEPNIYGNGIDWESYGQAYTDAIERSRTRTLKNPPIVSIWDELTNARGKFEDAPNIIPFVIATPRKRNEHCILISHNLTQGCLGGCDSISEPIKTQTYRLKLKTNPESKPLFKGILQGLVNDEGDELEDHPVTLPEWLRPEKIYGHFNGTLINFNRE